MEPETLHVESDLVPDITKRVSQYALTNKNKQSDNF